MANGMDTPMKNLSGTFDISRYIGNPGSAADRQFASSGGVGYNDSVNIADKAGTNAPELYMVPDFQGMSGQGANQSTNRPRGST